MATLINLTSTRHSVSMFLKTKNATSNYNLNFHLILFSLIDSHLAFQNMYGEKKTWKYETTAERNARRRFDDFYSALNRSEAAQVAHSTFEISTKHPEHYLTRAADVIEKREHVSPRPLTVIISTTHVS